MRADFRILLGVGFLGWVCGPVWAAEVPMPKVAADLEKRSFDEIHALARQSPPERASRCAELRSGWEGLGAWIQAQPSRSAQTMLVSQRYLAAAAASCDSPFELLHAFISDLGRWGGRFLGANYGFPTTILKILPSPEFIAEKTPERTTLDIEKAFAFFGPAILQGVRTGLCPRMKYSRMGIPPDAACMADWMWSNLEGADEAAFAPLSDEARKRLQASVEELVSGGEIRSWSPLLSLPFRIPYEGTVSRFAGSAAVARSILARNSPEGVAGLLSAHATALAPVLHVTQARGLPDCAELVEKGTAVVRALPKNPGENDPAALPVLGHLLSLGCARKPQEATKPVMEAISADYAFQGALSEANDVAAAVISEGESLQDMRFRDMLELRFHYGASFDLEDWGNLTSEERRAATLDSIVAFRVRMDNLTPWIHLAQNVEDVAEQQDLMAKGLTELGVARMPARRLLQMAYLDSLDIAPLSWGEEASVQARIRRVRDISQLLKSEFPRMRPLSNLIHNGIHRGLVDAVGQMSRGLSEEERKEFGSYVEALEKNLRDLYALDIPSGERLKALSASWKPLQGKSGPMLARLVVSGGARSPASARARSLVKAALLVVRDLQERESRNGGNGRDYVTGLRILREIHAALGESGISDGRDARAYASALEIPEGKTLKEQLSSLFSERLARMRWLLLAQRHRITGNAEIANAWPERIRTVDGFIDSFVRTYAKALVRKSRVRESE